MSKGDHMLENKRLKAELEQLKESSAQEIEELNEKMKENTRQGTLREVKGQEAIAEAERLKEEVAKLKAEAAVSHPQRNRHPCMQYCKNSHTSSTYPEPPWLPFVRRRSSRP